jgi:hypothetical protein
MVYKCRRQEIIIEKNVAKNGNAEGPPDRTGRYDKIVSPLHGSDFYLNLML